MTLCVIKMHYLIIKRTTNTLNLDIEDLNYVDTYKYKCVKKDKSFLKWAHTYHPQVGAPTCLKSTKWIST